MTEDAPTEGDSAIDALIAHLLPLVAAAWDGKTARVALVVQRAPAAQFTHAPAAVAFVRRDDAVARLRRLAASPGPLSGQKLVAMAELLSHGRAVEGVVQCAVVGWGVKTVLELEAAQLRALAAPAG
jgi:hypothetical protein